MNIGRLTGWTPQQVMWEISLQTTMKMLGTVEAPKDKDGMSRSASDGEVRATPFLAAAQMGMQIRDFTKEES